MLVLFAAGEVFSKADVHMTILIMAGMLMPAVFVFLLKLIKKKEISFQCIWLIMIFLSGIAGAAMYQAYSAEDMLLRTYDSCQTADKNIYAEISGRISQITEKEDGVWLYLPDCDADWIYENTQYHEEGQGIICIVSDADELKHGYEIKVRAALCRFAPASNPGEFDRRNYYENLGYRYYIKAEDITIIKRSTAYIHYYMDGVRKYLRSILEKISTKRDFGVYNAVLLGDKSSIDEAQKQSFSEQGIAHLFSVSGMHISAAGMLIYWILRKLTGSFAAAGIGGAVSAALYGLLTANPVSALRAEIMYILLVYGQYKGLIYDRASAAAFAALILLFRNPLSLFTAAMQLSFAAVFGVSTGADVFRNFMPDKRSRAYKLTAAVTMQIVMLPIVMYNYFQYPFLSMVINALILPFASFLLIIPTAGICVSAFSLRLAKLVMISGHELIRYYDFVCALFAKLDNNIVYGGQPSLRKIILYYGMLALLGFISRIYRTKKKQNMTEALEKNYRLKCWIVFFTALIFYVGGIFYLNADKETQLAVTMIDIGQGDCFLIQLPDGINILSDGGSTSKNNCGSYIIEPVLLSKGIHSLDYVFISHPDTDHMGGIIELIEADNIEIHNIMLPDAADGEKIFENLLSAAKEHNILVKWLSKGDMLAQHDCSITILSPEKGEAAENVNDISLVYKLAYGDFSMLFTGDISAQMEKQIEWPGHVSVLKAPHHGSDNSTSDELLKAVSPDIAFISFGKDNQYGHPGKNTIKRLEDNNITVFKSAVCGAVCLKTDGKKITVDTYN